MNACADTNRLETPLPPAKEVLDIQALHIQRVLFNKLPARFRVLAHQRARKIRAGQAPTAAPNVFSLN